MALTLDLVLTLKKVSIFNDIPDHILAEIAELIEIEELPKDYCFIQEGTIGDSMYIIKSGAVRVHRNEKTLATMSDNEIVGELAVLSPINRTANVVTEVPTVLYKIYREFFIDLLSEQPEIMKKVLNNLVNKLIHINSKYIDSLTD